MGHFPPAAPNTHKSADLLLVFSLDNIEPLEKRSINVFYTVYSGV